MKWKINCESRNEMKKKNTIEIKSMNLIMATVFVDRSAVSQSVGKPAASNKCNPLIVIENSESEKLRSTLCANVVRNENETTTTKTEHGSKKKANQNKTNLLICCGRQVFGVRKAYKCTECDYQNKIVSCVLCQKHQINLIYHKRNRVTGDGSHLALSTVIKRHIDFTSIHETYGPASVIIRWIKGKHSIVRIAWCFFDCDTIRFLFGFQASKYRGFGLHWITH